MINTYDMQNVYRDSQTHNYPNHHLFGALQLERDFEMELIIPEQVRFPILDRIGNWFDIEFLDQQLRAIFTLRKYDVLYAPYAAKNTKLIVLLKFIGIIRKPIIINVHVPLFGKISSKKWTRAFVKMLIQQYDKIIFFNKTMKDEIVKGYEFDSAYVDEHFEVSQWGVDTNFFQKFTTVPDAEKIPLFSSGNTGRDFDTLVMAASKFSERLKIYCRDESYPKSIIPQNVKIQSGEFAFERICKDQASARIVLIPIAPGIDGMIGYTSLLDAIAMGKPVIMTRNCYIDLDIERENIGLYVDEEDVDGWITAIECLLSDATRLEEMSINSFRLASKRFHIDTFAQFLATCVTDAYQTFHNPNPIRNH